MSYFTEAMWGGNTLLKKQMLKIQSFSTVIIGKVFRIVTASATAPNHV